MLGEFISKIKGAGLARPNKYSVLIYPPVALGLAPRDLSMMAESVSFPGQNIRAGTDVLRHGPQREVAQGMTYGPFSITFICTEGMLEKRFFETWQEFSVNKESWEPRFYKEYVGRIFLKSLNVAEQPTYTVEILEAYPKTVNAQEFSYGSTGAYQTISVEITYRYWTSRSEVIPSVTPTITDPILRPTAPMKWVNPNGTNELKPWFHRRAQDRHPPAIDEKGVNITPAVPNPADQQFYPSAAQPVAQRPNNRGMKGSASPTGVGDGQ